jgi:hypothetical protein
VLRPGSGTPSTRLCLSRASATPPARPARPTPAAIAGVFSFFAVDPTALPALLAPSTAESRADATAPLSLLDCERLLERDRLRDADGVRDELEERRGLELLGRELDELLRELDERDVLLRRFAWLPPERLPLDRAGEARLLDVVRALAWRRVEPRALLLLACSATETSLGDDRLSATRNGRR